LQQYAALKDSLTNKQFLWRLTNYKKQDEFKRQLEQVALLNAENKTKEQALKDASELTWILISALVIAALSSFIWYRNLSLKRKNEKLENEKNNRN